MRLQAFIPIKSLAKNWFVRDKLAQTDPMSSTYYWQTYQLTLSSRRCFFSHCLRLLRCLHRTLSLSVTAVHCAFLPDSLGVNAYHWADMKELSLFWSALCISQQLSTIHYMFWGHYWLFLKSARRQTLIQNPLHLQIPPSAKFSVWVQALPVCSVYYGCCKEQWSLAEWFTYKHC